MSSIYNPLVPKRTSASVPITEEEGAISVQVFVSPRASRSAIGPIIEDRIKIFVAAPPVDGKANRALVKLLARELKVPRSQIEILSGKTGRRKTVRVEGVTKEQFLLLVESRS